MLFYSHCCRISLDDSSHFYLKKSDYVNIIYIISVGSIDKEKDIEFQ
jgi:hypothetical protein